MLPPTPTQHYLRRKISFVRLLQFLNDYENIIGAPKI